MKTLKEKKKHYTPVAPRNIIVKTVSKPLAR